MTTSITKDIFSLVQMFLALLGVLFLISFAMGYKMVHFPNATLDNVISLEKVISGELPCTSLEIYPQN